MPDLSFSIEGAEALSFAATPTLAFRLRLANGPSTEKIHTVALQCQIQIEATRRRYTPADQAKLRDLFDTPDRWSRTLRNLLWTHVSCAVPAFQSNTAVDLHVPCTFDFNVGSTKYFYGLDDGEIPLCFQFSGNVFYVERDGSLAVAPISWSKECRFKLPVKVWKEMMELYYPNSAWLCLRRDVFDRLYRYKVERGMPTWEEALESVLQVEKETVKA